MKVFVCSLCYRGGVLGGALHLDERTLTYKTNKLTVDKKIRNLEMPLEEITEITWKRVLFPLVTVHLKNGEAYQFLMFNKAGFEEAFREYHG